MFLTTKRCGACSQEKRVEEFPKNHLIRDGYGNKCKLCQNSYARENYARNRERVLTQRREKKANPDRRLRLNWKAREAYVTHQKFRKKAKEYNLNIEEVQRLLAGGCAICGCVPDPGHSGTAQRTLHIDHDHKTNRVRGALCHSCNAGLGRFRDDPLRLRKAANYLEKYNEGF